MPQTPSKCLSCMYKERDGEEEPCFSCVDHQNLTSPVMHTRRVGGTESRPEYAVSLTSPTKAEYTGGSVSYYTVKVTNPTSGRDAYAAECNDIIEALGMNYAEGNAFKAIWRRCAARQGKAKAGYKDGLYDAEKVVFFGERMVAQEKAVRDGN